VREIRPVDVSGVAKKKFAVGLMEAAVSLISGARVSCMWSAGSGILDVVFLEPALNNCGRAGCVGGAPSPQRKHFTP